jgi:hypothetical protein
MATPVTCEICGEEMDPRGLHGHLRFAHESQFDCHKPSNDTRTKAIEEALNLHQEEADLLLLSVVILSDREGRDVLLRSDTGTNSREQDEEICIDCK